MAQRSRPRSLTRARMSEIGSASSRARALGTTPLGVLGSRGSSKSRRKRPMPWLTADGERFSRLGGAAEMTLLVQHDLEQHEEVEVGARDQSRSSCC